MRSVITEGMITVQGSGREQSGRLLDAMTAEGEINPPATVTTPGIGQ